MQLQMKLSQIAEITNGSLHGNDCKINRICTDTRIFKPGDAFLAIKGETHNSHDFINDVIEQGGVAIISQEPCKEGAIPMVYVKDTIEALGKISAFHRQQFDIPIIAVTGSNGKTTTRAMLESICRVKGPTHASIHSYNNHIGLPMTLLDITPEHQFVVAEMGTNHFGELEYLTNIAKPTVAAITNVGPSHLEFLGDLKGVEKAKGEIFQGLPQNGTAVINIKNKNTPNWENYLNSKKVLTFGLDNNATVYAKHCSINSTGCPSFILVTPEGEIEINLPLLGNHNIDNSLAAAACALAVGIRLEHIKSGLEAVEPESKRLNYLVNTDGVTIIDDTYNANPASVKAAIDVLTSLPGENKILVLGDMGELGDTSEGHHESIGKYAKEKGIGALYACGKKIKLAVTAFGENSHYFTSQDDLIEALLAAVKKDDTVLIKGSRSEKMENVVKALSKGYALC